MQRFSLDTQSIYFENISGSQNENKAELTLLPRSFLASGSTAQFCTYNRHRMDEGFYHPLSRSFRLCERTFRQIHNLLAVVPMFPGQNMCYKTWLSLWKERFCVYQKRKDSLSKHSPIHPRFLSQLFKCRTKQLPCLGNFIIVDLASSNVCQYKRGNWYLFFHPPFIWFLKPL